MARQPVLILSLLLFRLMLGVCRAEWGRQRWRGAHRDVEEEAQRAQVRYAVELRRARDEREECELFLCFFASSFALLVLLVPEFLGGRY